MAKAEFEGAFEVFDVTARRLRNGNKLRVVLESPYDKDAEKALVDLKFKQADVSIAEREDPELDFEEEGEGDEG